MRDIISPRSYIRPDRTVQAARRVMSVSRRTIITETIETETPAPLPIRPVQDLSVDQKVGAMVRALEQARKEIAREQRKGLLFKRLIIGMAAIVILLSTGYVGIDTWLSNNRLQAGASKGASDTVSSAAASSKDQEGTDEAKPTTSVLDSYVVTPDQPRALYINKLAIAARVLPMAVNSDGSIQAPRNIFDSGWYMSSAKPGEAGAMFIDGHASGATREGLFAYLDQLMVGDIVTIQKGDGTRLNYKVVHAEVVPLDGLDMKSLLKPYDGVTHGLNLMTCTGKWIESQKTYDHRVAVWTEQV